MYPNGNGQAQGESRDLWVEPIGLERDWGIRAMSGWTKSWTAGLDGSLEGLGEVFLAEVMGRLSQGRAIHFPLTLIDCLESVDSDCREAKVSKYLGARIPC